MGHLVRSLSLARAMREFGHLVCFVMRELPGHARQMVIEAGFEVLTIAGDSVDESRPQLTPSDLEQTQRLQDQRRASGVLVDHYGATSAYLMALKEQGITLVVIDDMADRDLTAADLILNQNLGATTLSYCTRPDCIKLLGPTYALLREEFIATRQRLVRRFAGHDNHLLITLGGGDTAQLCAQVLHALNGLPRKLSIRCLLGRDGPTPSQLQQAATASPHTVHLLHQVSNMAAQMAWADLSINAGGSTCWELCSLGVPMIVLVLSDDQRLGAKSLEQAGCARRLEEWSSEAGEENKLGQLVAQLMNSQERRAKMSQQAQKLVDGLGAERVAKVIEMIIN
jgi:UDP-2,4-diacetamido-2,4,6-trideoxy-beta-L-altropyranose hydrolase